MSRSSISDDGLRGGLFGTGVIAVKEKSHALAVPAAAMRKDDEGDFVLAVENDVLVRKPVGAVRTWSRASSSRSRGSTPAWSSSPHPCPGSRPDSAVKIVETR